MADGIITRRGGNQGESKPLDIPISIQLTQPIPIRTGHLWIKADISNQITNVVIDRALKANAVDGTIQLIVPLDPHKLKISQSIAITNSKDVPITLTTAYTATKWALNNLSNSGNIVQIILDNYPIVYSKSNGVLDIETSYIWDGTIWVSICTKGKYLQTNNKIYNVLADNSLLLNYTMPNLIGGAQLGALTQFSGDGKIAISGSIWGGDTTFRVYYRVGDVWSEIWSKSYNVLSTSLGAMVIRYAKVSKNGRIIFLCDVNFGSGGTGIVAYEVENGVMVEKDCWYTTRKTRDLWQMKCFVMNDDASRIAFPVTTNNSYTDQASGYNWVQIVVKGLDGKYKTGGRISANYGGSQPNMCPIVDNTRDEAGFVGNQFYGVGQYSYIGTYDEDIEYFITTDNFVPLKQAVKVAEGIYIAPAGSGTTLRWYNSAGGGNSGTITLTSGGAFDYFQGGVINSSDLAGNMYCTMHSSDGNYYSVMLTPTISNGTVTAVTVTKWLVNHGGGNVGNLTHIAPQL
jgi:hypothetical protein